MGTKKQERIGEKRYNADGSEMVITGYNNCKDVEVTNQSSGKVRKMRYTEFVKLSQEKPETAATEVEIDRDLAIGLVVIIFSFVLGCAFAWCVFEIVTKIFI
jgi:hypothetical protein